jgi:hypothetical protein
MNRQLADLRAQMSDRLRKFVQGQATVLAAKEAEVAELQQAAEEAEVAELQQRRDAAAEEEAARQAVEEEAARQAKTPSWLTTDDKEEPLLVKSSWRKAGARSWRKSPAPVTAKPPVLLAPLAPEKAAPAPVAADDFGSPSSSQVTHHNGRALHRRTREAVAKPKAGRAVVSGGALLAPSSRKTKLKPAGPKPKAGPVAPSPAKSDCSDLDFLEDFNF